VRRETELLWRISFSGCMVATLMFAPTSRGAGLLVGPRGGFDRASQTATQQLQCGPNWPRVAPHRHGNSGGVYSV